MKQAEKIVATMCENRDKKWWYPPDFMKSDSKYFVGYEASARLSELVRDNPLMFDSTKLDKYLYRRIKWETIDEWLPAIPKNLREIVEATGGRN